MCASNSSSTPLLTRLVANYSFVMERLHNYRVNEHGCWIYLGDTSSGDYGRFQVEGKKVGAHRAAYVMRFMHDPRELCVCHSCDTPCCINPEHLFLGTHLVNSQDKFANGRQPNNAGARNPNSKLDERKVRRIKRLISRGLNNKQIARRFAVTHGTISLIRLRKSWNHVSGEVNA